MKRLDRFILKSFIGPFAAILLVVMFILVMQFLWVYIDELVGKGLSFSVILEFLMWGGCTILPLAMPLATLLASMWTIGQMSENNELIAVKSAGVSLVRIAIHLFRHHQRPRLLFGQRPRACRIRQNIYVAR